MRILFIGTVEFSKRALEKLIALNANIVAVFTKKISNYNADFVKLEPLCKKYSIPCYFVDNINDSSNIKLIKSFRPDVIYCFGFSQLIKRDILDIPKLGVIGFHPAKYPLNRGRHPIIWALFLSLKKTALTFL